VIFASLNLLSALSRVLLIIKLVVSGGVLGCVFAVPEVIGLIFALKNKSLFKTNDQHTNNWHALIEVGGYLLGAAFIPKISITPEGFLTILVIGYAVLHCTLMMGKSYTIGVPLRIEIVERGLYRFVRHPQQALRLLVIAVLAVEGAPLINVLVLVALCLAIVYNEENLWASDPDYIAYKNRVPFKLIPKLI